MKNWGSQKRLKSQVKEIEVSLEKVRLDPGGFCNCATLDDTLNVYILLSRQLLDSWPIARKVSR